MNAELLLHEMSCLSCAFTENKADKSRVAINIGSTSNDRTASLAEDLSAKFAASTWAKGLALLVYNL